MWHHEHFHPYYHRRFHSGRPSRLLWFVFGGIAATWWTRRKEIHGFEGNRCCQPRIKAPAVESTAAQPDAVPVNSTGIQWQPGWGRNEWDEDKERMKAMAVQAADAMSEMSEATLESILTTVEALKAKLAEHRAQRDEQKRLEQQLEEQKNNQMPRRWV